MAWKSHIKEQWKDVGYLSGWKHPRGPRMALPLGDERATEAVLSFLRKTKLGQMVTIPPPEAKRRKGKKAPREGGTRWGRGVVRRGPPQDIIGKRPEGGRPQDVTRGSAFPDVLFVVSSRFFVSAFLSFFGEGIWEKGEGLPHLDGRTPHVLAGKCRLGSGFGRCLKADKNKDCYSPFRLDAAV